jgi:serine/threonine protein phosphatase PrpC
MAELKLDIASFSEAGIKPQNEDSVGYYQPSESYALKTKGVALCVADGVSTAEAGKEASETAVNHFMDEYYRTPDTWTVGHSGEKILSTLNLNLYRKSNEFSSNKGFLCTFSAMIIKGSTGHFFHVGDSRIYLLRQGELKQITKDHTAKVSDNHSVLARAMGMDNRLHIDYGRVNLEEGDRLMLSSDGVHDFISSADLSALLSLDQPLKHIAQAIRERALGNASDDNLSAVIAQVDSLYDQDQEELTAELTRLPFPPDMRAGMRLDGYRVVQELFASSRSQLYLVEDESSGKQCVMKTPSLNFDEDMAYIDRFVQEEWIGLRIQSPNVVQLIQQGRDRTALYYLMEHIEGMQLDAWMKEHCPPSPKQAIQIVKQVAQGLQAFHEYETVHQDLKPGNIMVKPDGGVVIVDFGSVYVAGLAELDQRHADIEALGTAGYSDPNYIMGRNPGFAGDVYSLATITYELFTGQLPYGEAINDCRYAAEFDRLRYRPASELNPQIPLWFDRALEQGVKFGSDRRYQSVAQFMKDLTSPNPEFLRDEPPSPKRANTELFWKLMSGFWFATLLLVIYLFSQS